MKISNANADEDADMLTKLLGVLEGGGQGGKQGFLWDLGASFWCWEGLAQHSGRHVGITKLWPHGGVGMPAHPPFPSATGLFRDRATFFDPSQDAGTCLWPCFTQIIEEVKVNDWLVSLGYSPGLSRFACSFIFQAQGLHLRSWGFKSSAAVGVLWRSWSLWSVLWVWFHPFPQPHLRVSSLATLSQAEAPPSGASWFRPTTSQPFGLDRCFSNFIEHEKDLGSC